MKERKDEGEKTAEELMNKPIIWASAGEKCSQVSERMQDYAYSQLPVRENLESVGSVSVEDLIGVEDSDVEVRKVMGDSLPEVEPGTSRKEVAEILKDESAILVNEDGDYIGIITKSDLIHSALS